jgi:probable phosphomutase (TIGR03848 family)
MPPRLKPKTPPTTVLLVRHGTTATTGKVLPGRAGGLHLSDAGRAQAQAVAERIGALKRVDAVHSSPLERARETAAPIAAARGLRVTIDRALVECDFGEWTGAELRSLARQPDWATVQRYPSGFRFPGGESFIEMAARAESAVSALVTRYAGGVVVAVSHADPIKAVMADALGTPLDLFQRIVISPCSVSAVMYGHLGPIVLAVNHTGDLVSLHPS